MLLLMLCRDKHGGVIITAHAVSFLATVIGIVIVREEIP